MPIDSEALLTAKLHDGIKLSQKRPFFIGFLTEEEASFSRELLERERDISYLFWGGYDEAERTVLGIFPEFIEPDETLFPVSALTLSYRPEYALSHRDFLGSFMSLGIERSVVGDIVINKPEGVCTAFIRREMEKHFLGNITKIGRTGVKITTGISDRFKADKEFTEMSGVIASQRLDCVVSFLCRTGRGKGAELIRMGYAAVNHREVLSVSEQVAEGDVITVRGCGKFIIDSFGPFTSKGRLAVKCRKYK